MIKKLPKVGDVIKSDKIIFEGHDEWIVVDIFQEPNQTGIHPNEVIIGGLRITVRQLNPDGTYNDKGFEYKFHINGKYNDLIDLSEIELVRKMKRIFV
jgi:hypothetical protein